MGLVLLAAGCGSTASGDAQPVLVGAWPSLEPRLLSETIVALLAAESIDATIREFGDAAAARQALELGEVELLPGYTGAAWLEVLGRSDPPGDVGTSFARVREFDERAGLLWLRPTFEDGWADSPPADATFSFFVLGPPALDARLTTMSQLASRLSEDPTARLCIDEDFSRRPDGREAVYRAYGISVDRSDFAAAPEAAVAAVRDRGCLAGLATTTDGSAWLAGLTPLIDDLSVFPAFGVAIVARQSVLQGSGLPAALGPFSSQLTSDLLARHNGAVLRGGSTPAALVEAGQALAATLRARAGVGQGGSVQARARAG